MSRSSKLPPPAPKAAKRRAPQKSATKKGKFSDVWHSSLEKGGFTQVSNYFLLNYHRLKPYDLTHGEAMFVVHLMQHKWTSAAPYPAYKTIAKRMGVSIKTARRFAQSLSQKTYLKREVRKGETNKFHFGELIRALVALQATDAADEKKKTSSARRTHDDND